MIKLITLNQIKITVFSIIPQETLHKIPKGKRSIFDCQLIMLPDNSYKLILIKTKTYLKSIDLKLKSTALQNEVVSVKTAI